MAGVAAIRRLGLGGLRGRLLLGLLVTWAVTLTVVSIALLQPLERRLRHDAVATLASEARAARVLVRDLEPSQLQPGAPAARNAVHAIRRRANADALLIGRDGAIIAATDIDRGLPLSLGVQALRDDRVISQVLDVGSIPEAQVALPAATDGKPVGLILRRRLDGVASAVRVVRRAVIVAALIGLGTALLLGALLTRPLIHRLRGLRDTALRVARMGPNVEVVPDEGRDEVADLTRAFATMQDRLREQEQARRAFVSTASHELRTPVTSLRLALELLREEVGREPPPPPERLREQLHAAADQAERMGRLADQLLDLSRLDAGVPPASELVDVRSVSRLVAHELDARARDSDRPLELDGDGEAPAWAIADPGAVAQIVRILLDNALRFGPAGAAIHVDVRNGQGACLVRVRDAGPGVAPAERELIFERFQRGRGASGEAGFGLGLAIGRELARRMGGDLTLADDGEPGACFELRLVPAPGA